MNYDIDFLPASFREAGIQRKNIGLRVVAVVAFVGLIAFAAVYQQYLRHWSDQQLADIVPHYELAKLETVRLAQLQQQLQTAQRKAELCTYLQHPWPRSQLLAAIVDLLPDAVQLTTLEMVHEPLPNAASETPRPSDKAGELAMAKLEPAHRDLLALRDECEKRRLIVKLTGITDDTPALHDYFDQLGRVPLFEKVDVGGVEHHPGEPAAHMHFVVSLIVRPGYGQNNGPMPSPDTVTAIGNQ